MTILTIVGATLETIKVQDPKWFEWLEKNLSVNAELSAKDLQKMAEAGLGLITTNELMEYFVKHENFTIWARAELWLKDNE